MRPLYTMTPYGGIRPERATPHEIEGILRGKSSERLACVTLGADGEIVARPLNEIDLSNLRESFQREREQQLHALLDATLALYRKVTALGFSWSSPFSIWPAEEPWAEDVVRTWAAECGLEVVDESPPRDAKTWIRSADVRIGYVTIVHMQWPSVRLGEVAIAVEAMCIGLANAFADRAGAP